MPLLGNAASFFVLQTHPPLASAETESAALEIGPETTEISAGNSLLTSPAVLLEKLCLVQRMNSDGVSPTEWSVKRNSKRHSVILPKQSSHSVF
jgi:hypothetical protein